MAQVLIFGLGAEWYAIEICRVREVVLADTLHPVPRAPAALLGAVNFHGSVVPVLDLGAWLGFARGARDARIIVLEGEALSLALAVDRIHRIFAPAAEDFFPCADADVATDCIGAHFLWRGEVVNLLDVDRLIASLGFLASGGTFFREGDSRQSHQEAIQGGQACP
ncbi:chemotaxis protein CheW [Geoalkalibacter halelectricus]|uniref:Chemotaxis protein CheW n=1 Tax=Geoalkalibacter halelectricus TaxID=2847045 RepID=A0ABY5ZMA0_9BACT|nr:chemotaxis protein CheW [Geoalkalibacter halelectricus]MDO3378388.1 chemotaxis protein CheW [Geoalkalibacter halelectricus]UWZ80292.1 chemotaxis protein CheW [Geoalkalibacter halelectricus]